MAIENASLRGYTFLKGMLDDRYYPKSLVRKGQRILERLCERIEADSPQDLVALYALTHHATEEFNDLAEAFDEADSEFETVAREVTASDFEAIANAYGFQADREELISAREW